MSELAVIDTPLGGLKIVQRQQQSDPRGFFSRLFCADELAPAGWSKPIAQINQTLTGRAGIVRGMHFQFPPHAEMKLVSCLRGAVWDVAVDLRRGSPTFLKWFGTELSPGNGRAMLVPEGFAHGFQALAADSELIYFHSTRYDAASEGGVHPQDQRLGISWPQPIAELSARDRAHPMLPAGFQGISL